MNGFIDFVFGLNSSGPDALGLGDEGVRLEMTRELPLWVWMPVLLGVVGLAALSYWRLSGGVRGRVVLACVRALLLVVLVVVAAGPRLVRDNERVERDAVAVLVDRSASMAMPDGGRARAGQGERGTRDAQLRRVVGDAVWAELAAQHDLVWLGFDGSAYEIDPAEPGQADGARTRLGGAVRAAVERLSGRPIAGVVVVSDGRTSDPPDARLMRELSASRVGVFAVPLGSEEPLVDIAVEGVDAPTSAFVGDFVPVTARLTARGSLDDSGAPVRVVLVDTLTGIELDAQEVEAGAWEDGVAQVRLATRPEAAAAARWAVRIEGAGEGVGAGDLLAENNERSVEVDLIDRPLRVLYFDGYPRWEYRYVKDLLVREASIRSSVMLLATDRRYIQEGDVGLSHVPRSSGEWGEFDVVVIGDVRPDVFSTEQLEQLRDQVAQRGAGLVWIAGPGSTPWRWAATPLGDLLPFTATAEGGGRGYSSAEGSITLRREAAAARLGVLEMADGSAAGWLDSLSDAALHWPVLRWSLAIEPGAVKATAEVLASAVPVGWGGGVDGTGSGELSPGVLTMRYGAGRVVFVGTDEIWRWRYGRGEALPERFYLPLVRLAGRGSIARSGRPVVLEALPGVVSVGTPVRLGAVLLDQSLVDAAPPALRVRVTRVGAEGAAEISLGAEGAEGGEGRGVGGGGRGRGGAAAAARYAASWVAGEPGEYVVEAIDPLLAAAGGGGGVGVGARARFRVVSPDDERRVPEADHGLLAALATRTGGAVVEAGELSRLLELVPNRSVVVAGEPDVETLWDKPVVLLVLVLLLGAEWVGRRVLKLA
ncbi:MAG: hypothetical protein Q9O74_07320 [Planctomycetota bacterium]|nr:hypothetical protein [Planctomycetota bacterium]